MEEENANQIKFAEKPVYAKRYINSIDINNKVITREYKTLYF